MYLSNKWMQPLTYNLMIEMIFFQPILSMLCGRSHGDDHKGIKLGSQLPGMHVYTVLVRHCSCNVNNTDGPASK